MSRIVLLALVASASAFVSKDGKALLRAPTSINEAKRWHRVGMRNARLNAKSHGHHMRPDGSAELRHQQMVGTFNPGRSVSPVDFGADPTGATDATQGVVDALKALLALNSTKKMAANITDMGGATLDLRGGNYLISQPLHIPTFVGNMRITGGTLRASPTFPKSAFLLNIGADNCKTDSQGSCNEEISVTSVMLDASHVALGGLYVSHTMGCVVTDSFFTGFTGYGIQVTAGHELMVSYSWFCEYYWSDSHPTTDSVGIELNGNDNYIVNVIVFDYTRTGVVVNGAANIMSSVHTWNGGGVGISLGNPRSSYGAHQNRIEYCYLDYNTLDAYDPSDLVVTDTFFLVTHMVIHGSKMSGLRLSMNSFTQAQTIVLNGTFTENSVSDVVVTGIQPSLQTTAIMTKPLALPSVTFDFSKQLLFPWIRHTVVSTASKWIGAQTTVSGTTVTVTGGDWSYDDGTITVEVHQ